MSKVTEKKAPAQKKAKKPTGRPSQYSKEKCDNVVELMHQGVWITEACRKSGLAISSFLKYCDEDHDGLRERSMRAREVCYEVMGHKTIELAQTMPLTNPMTGAIDSAAVQWHKLQIETMFRLLGKLSPKRWGDKIELDHSGKVGIEALIAGAGSEPAGN